MDIFQQIENSAVGLINYGPYALAALFLLFLAPKHTKRFVEFEEKNKKKQNFLLGVAVANWFVAFLMCFYIYSNWSPVMTYQGSLGIHSDKTSFITSDPNSYIASHTPGGDHLEWQFAYISQSSTIKQDENFKFTHLFHGDDKDHFTFYQINAKILKQGDIQISANEDDPSKLVMQQGESVTPLKPVATYSGKQHPWQFMAAYAAPPANASQIIKKLSSSNIHFKVSGQRKLRQLSKNELQEMLRMPNIPDSARRQIQAALSRR